MWAGGVIAASIVTAAGSPAAEGCVLIARDLRTGEIATHADLAPAPCPAGPRAAFRYDRRSGALAARTDLQRGDTVAKPPAAFVPAVRPGEILHLTVRVGPVAIERAVTALQAGRSGGLVFVRGEDGAAFAVKVAELSR